MHGRFVPQQITTWSLCIAAALWFLSGCQPAAPVAGKAGGPAPAAGHDEGKEAHDHAHHHHAETGPHQGTLVAIGEDAAHLEILLDAETGKLTAYVLDGEAKNTVAIKQATLELGVSIGQGDAAKKKGELPDVHTITLTAVAPNEQGEATGFTGHSDELKGAKEFDAALSTITVAGKEHNGVSFNFPKGNEHHH